MKIPLQEAADIYSSIRLCSTINSYGEGGLFFLRRERGLIRFYVQLNRADEELPITSITQELIIERLQKLLRPYTVSDFRVSSQTTLIIMVEVDRQTL
jgi:hypothetical protein